MLHKLAIKMPIFTVQKFNDIYIRNVVNENSRN